jgi:hypothetical protein
VLSAASVGKAATALEGLPSISDTNSGRRGGRRRHGEHRAAQPGWLPTLERFRDPSSGRLMRVWIDPADASRHYVAEAT